MLWNKKCENCGKRKPDVRAEAIGPRRCRCVTSAMVNGGKPTKTNWAEALTGRTTTNQENQYEA
jgi:hypothetical protein